MSAAVWSGPSKCSKLWLHLPVVHCLASRPADPIVSSWQCSNVHWAIHLRLSSTISDHHFHCCLFLLLNQLSLSSWIIIPFSSHFLFLRFRALQKLLFSFCLCPSVPSPFDSFANWRYLSLSFVTLQTVCLLLFQISQVRDKLFSQICGYISLTILIYSRHIMVFLFLFYCLFADW